jgi:hypothetical protein
MDICLFYVLLLGMFVSDRWRGSQARVWAGTVPPTPAVPPSLTPGILLPGSDSPAGLEAVATIIGWQQMLARTPAGAGLAVLLDERPHLTDPVDRPSIIGAPAREPAAVAAPSLPLRANALVDSLRARQSLMAHLQARQNADLAELSAGYPGIHEFLATELALALGVAEGTANRQLAEAVDLTTRLPETYTALHEGRITPVKAATIRVHTQDLDLDQSALVEADVLPAAPRGTVPELRNAVQRAVIRHDPHGADDRHNAAKERRRVSTKAQPDGMGSLWLYSTAQDVATIHACLTAVGDAAKTPDDDRPLDARRVDAMVDLCAEILDSGTWRDKPLPTTQRRRPHVQVTVPITALLDPDSTAGQLADLTGYGPITPAQAQQIAADATLRRLVCDPLSGTLLDYGRTTYEPPASPADHVMVRDLTCMMPGCRQPAHRCELDHIDPFRPGRPTGGHTCDSNLCPLCKHHHRAKDGGEFTLTRTPDGYHWTTPLGRTYTQPPTRLWEPTPTSPPRRPQSVFATDLPDQAGTDEDPPPF